jgi:hypothetical protein
VLLTDCKVQLQADGSPTEDTQLQHWPRFAPPPKRLHLVSQLQQPGSRSPLMAFLGSCSKQELAVRLLRGVQDLRLYVRGQPGCMLQGAWLSSSTHPWALRFVCL